MELKKRMFLLFFVLLLSACGFNAETAVEKSEEQLEKFFQVYEDGEVIADKDNSELKKNIEEQFDGYFTTGYLEKVNQHVDEMEADIMIDNFKSPEVFFLSDLSSENDFFVSFNQYKFADGQAISADQETETVKANLVGVGNPTNMFVEVTMEEEDGVWKIADVIKQ